MSKPILDVVVIASLQGAWDGLVDLNFGRMKDLVESTPWPVFSQPGIGFLDSIQSVSEECIAVAEPNTAPGPATSGLPTRLCFNNGDQWLPLSPAYNAEEQLTGATWIDGRPIWRKTISVTVPTAAGPENTAHGIADLDDVVSLHAVVSDGSRRLPVPSQFGSSASMGIEADGTNIKLVGYGAGLSGFTGVATIDYVKTP